MGDIDSDATVKWLRESVAKAQIAKAAAEADSKAKDAFLAMVSHELRGPLNAIMAWTHVLRTGKGDLATGLDVIERNARIQQALIDELMDVSRVSTGELTINRVAVDVGALVRQVVEAARPAAIGKQLGLVVNAPEAPTVIAGDTLRLHQIVANILSNSMKYTPEGGSITVTVRAVDGYAELEIADTGIGIEPAMLAHVFEPFWQARRASNAYRGGLGLGLPIVRRLVHLHGGTIHASSDGPGQGTRMVVRLELAHGIEFPAVERRRAERRVDVAGRPPISERD